MKNSEFRVVLAILALVVVLGLLWGGFTLYNKLGIEEPLIKDLQAIEAISDVSITKNKIYVIEVKMGKVEDIQSVYDSLITTIESKLGEEEYKLVIIDKENKVLKDWYKELQPAIYQALANNEFMWLDERLAKTFKDGVRSNLFVDEKNLYIQLFNDDAYMYKVLPRPSLEKANV